MADKHVVPILLQLCTNIDRVFIEQVGPFGDLVVQEARKAWIAGGPRIKTSAVEAYISLLAGEIPDKKDRASFILRAHEVIGQYR